MPKKFPNGIDDLRRRAGLKEAVPYYNPELEETPEQRAKEEADDRRYEMERKIKEWLIKTYDSVGLYDVEVLVTIDGNQLETWVTVGDEITVPALIRLSEVQAIHHESRIVAATYKETGGPTLRVETTIPVPAQFSTTG